MPQSERTSGVRARRLASEAAAREEARLVPDEGGEHDALLLPGVQLASL